MPVFAISVTIGSASFQRAANITHRVWRTHSTKHNIDIILFARREVSHQICNHFKLLSNNGPKPRVEQWAGGFNPTLSIPPRSGNKVQSNFASA
jgi:hypothetical protein